MTPSSICAHICYTVHTSQQGGIVAYCIPVHTHIETQSLTVYKGCISWVCVHTPILNHRQLLACLYDP